MKVPKRLRFFVTDVDGVIIDRMPLYAEIFCELVTPYGINHDDAHTYYFDTAGTPVGDQFAGALSAYSILFSPDLIPFLKKHFFDQAQHVPAPLFPTALATLNRIHDHIPICATSGANTSELKSFVRMYHLPFSHVLGSDTIRKGVAHIEFFARQYDISITDFSAHSVFLGDGPRDMEIARECSIYAIGITNTVSAKRLRESGANAVITRIEEVLPLIGIR